MVEKKKLEYTVFEPVERRTDTPGVISSGVMAGASLYDEYAVNMAKRGVPMINFSRSADPDRSLKELEVVVGDVVELGQEPVRIHAHSNGNVDATRLAIDHPEYVSGLLAMQPVGYDAVTPRNIPASLLVRDDNWHILAEIRAITDAISYCGSARPDRVGRTLLRACSIDMKNMVERLDPSVARDAIIFPHDRLVDPVKVAYGLANAGFTLRTLDPVHRSGHNAIMYRPRAVSEVAASFVLAEPAYELAS